MTPKLDIQKAIKEALEDLRKRPLPKPKIIEVSPEQYAEFMKLPIKTIPPDKSLELLGMEIKTVDDLPPGCFRLSPKKEDRSNA